MSRDAGSKTPSAAAPQPSPGGGRPAATAAADAPTAAPPAPRAQAPTGFPPPVLATLSWLQERFAHFYAASPPPLPDRFTRREFGWVLWPERPGPPPFVRHRAFSDAARFHATLRTRAPHSVYYSTAYYRRPGEARMVDKQWLAAELIFDLDADHLPEAEAAKAAGREMPLDEQLARVKDHFKRLLDEFLLGDLGLNEKDVWITFSGGRGYHAHVVDPRFMDLDARARREIVDYITGKVPAERGSTTPDLSPFIRAQTLAVEGRGKFQREIKAERLAPADAPGWPGRLTRSLVETLRTHVLQAERAQARRWLLALDGVGDKSADAFLEDFDESRLRRIGQGYLEQGRVIKRVCHHVLAQHAIPMAKGETDEPVTADVKRLIRLPGSLHGKSGLRVVVLTRDALDTFEPLRDAVAFSRDPVRFTPRADQEATLAGETVRVRKGEPTEVPEAHAVFWCARQQGTVVPGSRPP